MDINHLPEEILLEIALYLNLQDLLSCCLVNSRWRNVINQNKIWARLCVKKYAVLQDKCQLIEEPCYVPPYFCFPKTKCDSLPELCNWRKRFMQEAHLSRNWRLGRFSSYFIITKESLGFNECDDSVLLVNDTQLREFIVYSITDHPRQVQIVSHSLAHVRSDFFKLDHNKLVVLQCTLLQVYDKTPDGQLQLVFRTLFNKHQSDSTSIPSSPDISEWYKNCIGLYPSDLNIACDHNGKYFVGIILEENLNKAVFHVWDICSHEKLAEKLLPEIEDRVLDIQFLFNDSILYSIIKVCSWDGNEHTILYSYNLENIHDINLILTYDYVVPILLFSEKFVINVDPTRHYFYLWGNRRGELRKRMYCDFFINPMTIQFAFSSVLLSGTSSDRTKNFSTVKIFNTVTMDVLCKFNVDYRVDNLLYVRPEMILTCGWNKLGLWDINSASNIQTLDYCDVMWSNKLNSKLVVELNDELYLLRFW